MPETLEITELRHLILDWETRAKRKSEQAKLSKNLGDLLGQRQLVGASMAYSYAAGDLRALLNEQIAQPERDHTNGRTI